VLIATSYSGLESIWLYGWPNNYDHARCAERSELTRRWSWPPQLVGAAVDRRSRRRFPDAEDALRTARAACACAGRARSKQLPSSAVRSSARAGGAARNRRESS